MYINISITGTLTQNKMTAIRAYCPGMEDAVLLISTYMCICYLSILCMISIGMYMCTSILYSVYMRYRFEHNYICGHMCFTFMLIL
jgi:hypothetical protein